MLRCVQLLVTPGTVACQAPLSKEFSRPEYWTSPGDLTDPSISCTNRWILCHWVTREALWPYIHIYIYLQLWLRAFPGGSDCKESACNAGDLGLIPGLGKSPGEGMATHSNILAWRIPWTEEPCVLQSMGSQTTGHNWATNTLTFKDLIRLPRFLSGKESACQCRRCRFYPWVRKIPWRRKRATHSSILT